MSEPGSAGAVARLVPSAQALASLAADTLLGFVFADEGPILGPLGLVDWQLCALVSKAVAAGTFVPRAGHSLLVPTFGRLQAKQLVVLGLGPSALWTAAMARQAAELGRQQLADLGAAQAAALLPTFAAGVANGAGFQQVEALGVLEQALLLPGPSRPMALLQAA